MVQTTANKVFAYLWQLLVVYALQESHLTTQRYYRYRTDTSYDGRTRIEDF